MKREKNANVHTISCASTHQIHICTHFSACCCCYHIHALFCMLFLSSYPNTFPLLCLHVLLCIMFAYLCALLHIIALSVHSWQAIIYYSTITCTGRMGLFHEVKGAVHKSRLHVGKHLTSMKAAFIFQVEFEF